MPLDDSSQTWADRGSQWDSDHKVWLVERAVAEWDCSALEDSYSGRGSAAHPPDLMLRLAVYETLQGQGSPNRWAQDAGESSPVAWLLRGMRPSSRACYRFRDRLGDVIEAIHNSIIQHEHAAQSFPDPEEVAQDGSFHRACASRHRLVNDQQLEKRSAQLDERVQAEHEGREPPADQPYWMPPTAAGRADLQKRMKQARETLDQRLAANAKRGKSQRLAAEHVCVSLSDPEAPISRDKEKVFGPLYTAQYLTDYRTRLVLGFDVTATATDVGTLIPMIDKVQPLVGGAIRKVCTDSTYATVLELRACQERNVELIALVQENSWTEKKKKRKGVVVASNKQDFVWLDEEQTYQCPQGHQLEYQYQEQVERAGGRTLTMFRYHCPAEHCQACPLAAACVKDASRGRTVKRLEGQELLDAQRERMKQPEAQRLHRLRGSIVERTIADAKQHRDGRRLHGHGLRRATAEIGLKVIAQNLLTFHRLHKAASACSETN